MQVDELLSPRKQSEMKKFVLAFSVLIFMTAIVLPGCNGSVKKDAQQLVLLQKQKNEKVREILRCNDVETRISLLNEFQILETKYNNLKQQCEMKYADTLEKRKFENAVREGLKK